jgi:hypothetical protein
MAYKVLREIRKDLPRFCGRQIAIGVNPRVAEVLLARAHKACAELGRELGREIEVRGRPGLHQEQFEVTALDSGPPVSIPLQWLGFPPEPGDEKASTAELQTEVDEPSSAAAPDTTGPADTAADEPEPVPNAEATLTPNKSEASRETTEEGMGESVAALEPAGEELAGEPTPPESAPADAASEQTSREPGPADAASEQTSRESTVAVAASEQASGESTVAVAASEQTSRESTPAEADLEALPPEDGSTAEPASAANAGAAKGEKRFATPAPAVEVLDLEPKTPILPHPAEVEET